MLMCCGEALIDMLPRETAAGEQCFAPHAGGAVFNTSIALGRLGMPTAFLSGISTDTFGSILCDALDESGVDRTCAIYSARSCTLAFVTLVNGQANYLFYDENTAGRMLDAASLPGIPASARALFFGGISLVGEPCGSFYEALLLREAEDRVIMLDPNIRPAFITDEAAYRKRLARMLARTDIVKVSDEDLLWLTGKTEIEDGANDLLAGGCKVVFVTEGARGAHAYCGTKPVFVPAKKIEVIDTVGAGDTFNAGVLAALWGAGALTKSALATIDPSVLQTALTMGVKCAAITVSRAGANPPWEKEL
ncbi:MAG: carbohydrate kinase [Paracoccaceae bacterium]|nr:carbohydrate kinase [Paracoccaceae bacterium]